MPEKTTSSAPALSFTVDICRNEDGSAQVQTILGDIPDEGPARSQWYAANAACSSLLRHGLGDDYSRMSAVSEPGGARLEKLELWCLALLDQLLAVHSPHAAIVPRYAVIVDGLVQTVTLEAFALNHFDLDEWVTDGPIAVHEDLLVGDPCYGNDREAVRVTAPLQGNWLSALRLKAAPGHFGFGARCWELVAHHESFPAEEFGVESLFNEEGSAGVDSGQLGICLASAYAGLSEDPKYSAICDMTCGTKGKSLLDGIGWFASSGYGDGGYEVMAARNAQGQAVALRIVFISPDTPEDDDTDDANDTPEDEDDNVLAG